jgi:DNA-binding response OmpR family regulator
MPSDRPRVLIVEDDPDVRQVLEEGLAVAGFQVFAAGDADEAQRILASTEVEVAVFDAVLRRGSGSELIVAAKQQGIPVVLMSGNLDAQQRYTNAGVVFLAKPFRIGQLVAAMREAIAASHGD